LQTDSISAPRRAFTVAPLLALPMWFPGNSQPADLRLAKEESHMNILGQPRLAPTLNAQDCLPCPNLPADV
jgi:hypothetical protein